MLIFVNMDNKPSIELNETLINNIKSIIVNSRKNIIEKVNRTLVLSYWQIGKLIIENKEEHKIDNKSSRQIILSLSKKLTKEIGRVFSRSNLFNMRKFHIEYPNVQTLSGQLGLSHICELLIIDNKEKRNFYENEIINSNWSIRELKRQIESSLFERLVLSQGKDNKNKIIELSNKGQELSKPEDLIKNPYVFEFLGIPENKPLLEKDLEKKLIRHIEEFLLELGKGFMFVGSQQRITINNTHHYVDMVFYNKILRSYILIELKTRKLKITDAGQINTYLNFFKAEINDQSDNEPIGIILCTDKDEITAEYILNGIENKVFASKFTYVLPNKEDLIQQVENVIKEK